MELTGSKTENYLNNYFTDRLTGLKYLGDLKFKDDEYIFTTEALDGKIISFENSIFEVIEIDFADWHGCYVKLKVSASLIDLSTSKI
jgi:hypothetical protein